VVTFFSEAECGLLKASAGAMRAAGCEVPEWMLQMSRPSKSERGWHAHRKQRGKQAGKGKDAAAAGPKPEEAEVGKKSNIKKSRKLRNGKEPQLGKQQKKKTVKKA
jgi:hypothetical protein